MPSSLSSWVFVSILLVATACAPAPPGSEQGAGVPLPGRAASGDDRALAFVRSLTVEAAFGGDGERMCDPEAPLTVERKLELPPATHARTLALYRSFRVARVWLEKVAVACEPRPVNILLGYDARGRPWGSTLLPGDTLTDPILQNDLLRALPGVLAATPAARCAKPLVNDSVIVAQPNTAGWGERWTIGACGGSYATTVRFSNTADGGVDFSFTRPEPI